MGANTHFISKLGKDDFADLALATWKDAGVTPHVEQVASSYTGAACILIDDASGDNAIVIAPGAAALISAQDIEDRRALIEGASVFITQLEQPMDAAVAALSIAREAGVITILNPAPAAELPDGMLAMCDYVTPNETETEALTGVPVSNEVDAKRACAALRDLGVKTPIITMGERGGDLDGHGMVPALEVDQVIETTGAGDAFNGSFAAALSEGATPLEAVKQGCKTAGLSVTRPGAAASMPTLAEVEAL
jgi:ribokinase